MRELNTIRRSARALREELEWGCAEGVAFNNDDDNGGDGFCFVSFCYYFFFLFSIFP